jgi:hypothetical protein
MTTLSRRLAASLASLLIAFTMVAATASSAWEKLSQRDTAGIVELLDGDQIEVTVRDGMVYVFTAQPVVVSIFSILGQPITKTTVAPGGARFRLPTRGIYILKAGNTTRRITI